MPASSASPSGNASSFAPRILLIEDEPQITAEIIGFPKGSGHNVAERFDHHPELPTAEYIFKLIAPEILLDCVQRRLQKTLFPGEA